MSEAENVGRDRRQSRLAIAGLVWAGISVVSGVRNLASPFCTPYFDVWSWALTAAWLVSLLLLDAALYQARSTRAARLFLWYWGIATVLLGFLQFYPTPEGDSNVYQMLGG